MIDTKQQKAIYNSATNLADCINSIEDLRLAFTYLEMQLDEKTTELNTSEDGMANDDFECQHYNLFKTARRCLAIAIDSITIFQNK